MEFSEYHGPESIELQGTWSSLSEDQQLQINAIAENAFPEFVMNLMIGDRASAEQVMDLVLRQVHRIAGIVTV